ncbi:3-isopropylmalate dehydrogenase [Fusarium beomiforme]|uniref:3-isopropylmalate dehydrogenase n=1 Tax=Fusarium beomiforme TaxID=44412 RepID=A0A9P5AQF3_9HYPO|nr:3-isopropylmalate dehydrogenase [Fusarium beomiforme]
MESSELPITTQNDLDLFSRWPMPRMPTSISSAYIIVVLAGDLCGPEVVLECIQVLRGLEENKPSIGKANLQNHLLGGCFIEANCSPLTEDNLVAVKAIDAVLGSGLLERHKEMATYGSLQPCFYVFDSLVVVSTLKTSVCRGTHLFIVRELTGSILLCGAQGVRWLWLVRATEPDSRAEVERCTPDISDKRIINLVGTIMSVAMLLRCSLNLPAEAKAVCVPLNDGLRAKDLGNNATTKEIGDAVVDELEKILKASEGMSYWNCRGCCLGHCGLTASRCAALESDLFVVGMHGGSLRIAFVS